MDVKSHLVVTYTSNIAQTARASARVTKCDEGWTMSVSGPFTHGSRWITIRYAELLDLSALVEALRLSMDNHACEKCIGLGYIGEGTHGPSNELIKNCLPCNGTGIVIADKQ